VEFWVARDEPDPLFPLEVGNYWTFQWSSVENSRLLVFIDAGHTYESEPIQATVMREKVVHGLHIYEVEWFDPDFGFEVIEMYNWEGVVHGTPDFPYLQRGQQVTTLEEGGEVRTCTIGFFDDFVCQCLTAPTGNAGIPGPVRCVEVRGGNSDLAVLGSFLMGVLTGGTFIPDFDADVSWQMLESGRIEDPDAWKKDLDWSPEDLPLAECTGDDCPEGADGDGGEQDAGTADGTEEDVTTEGDA